MKQSLWLLILFVISCAVTPDHKDYVLPRGRQSHEVFLGDILYGTALVNLNDKDVDATLVSPLGMTLMKIKGTKNRLILSYVNPALKEYEYYLEGGVKRLGTLFWQKGTRDGLPVEILSRDNEGYAKSLVLRLRKNKITVKVTREDDRVLP